ncbi:MAG TPA: flagellin [Fimbriimonadaceae bacterium]|jgi:flagellin
MSFRINTNSDALTALQNLNNTGNALSASTNRLSTGLQITSAADNPAGYIRAQDFNAQLSGINQALSNNQDAINFSKTAAGALTEVGNLLNSARTLAVASGNGATLDSNAIQANQAQLNSIVSSINRIASTTTFGTKHLLDGSAGVTASNANAADFSAVSFTGQFNGTAITTASAVTVVVTQAATQAQIASSKTFGAAASVVSAGSFTLNGVSFTTTANETIGQVVQAINAAQGQTGVTANFSAGGAVTLTQTNYGSANSVNLSDATGVLETAAGSATASGLNAQGTATINNGTSLVTVNFTGGKYGNSALDLQDADGNSINLTVAGNATSTAQLAGSLSVGSAQFQIGGNAGDTASLSIGNFASSQLGLGAVSGLSLANLDLTTTTGATNALNVIDAAINQVSTAQGNIGNFQTNVLQAQTASLNSAQQNITSSLSSIQDVNVASEMTNYTKLQILEQAGVSVLAQANAAPQAILKLLG